MGTDKLYQSLSTAVIADIWQVQPRVERLELRSITIDLMERRYAERSRRGKYDERLQESAFEEREEDGQAVRSQRTVNGISATKRSTLGQDTWSRSGRLEDLPTPAA